HGCKVSTVIGRPVQPRGEESTSASDDPRIAKSRLPCRAAPGSLEQPGVIEEIFDPGSSGKPRKRRIQSGDLDLGCLRSATFVPNQRDSSAESTMAIETAQRHDVAGYRRTGARRLRKRVKKRRLFYAK